MLVTSQNWKKEKRKSIFNVEIFYYMLEVYKLGAMGDTLLAIVKFLKPHNSILYKKLNEDDHKKDNFLLERRRRQ
jgi:hypothetical protein